MTGELEVRIKIKNEYSFQIQITDVNKESSANKFKQKLTIQQL